MATSDNPLQRTMSTLYTEILREVVLQNATILCLDATKMNRVTKQLEGFVRQAIAKYIAGQREHGGNLWERDLPHEISKEIIDLFFYNADMLENSRAAAPVLPKEPEPHTCCKDLRAGTVCDSADATLL